MRYLQDYWLRYVAAVLALGALLTFPFVYYQVMNWAVMGAAITTSYVAFKQKKEMIGWLFIVLAVVFNPVAPLHLEDLVWKVLDVIAALLLVASLFIVPARNSRTA